MFLLLDVASPIPEFHLINDKKIINSIKITDNKDQKLSDLLIPTYLEIDTVYKLSDNLKKLIDSLIQLQSITTDQRSLKGQFEIIFSLDPIGLKLRQHSAFSKW